MDVESLKIVDSVFSCGETRCIAFSNCAVDGVSDGDLPWSFQFGLDDDSEGGIAVNILPLVVPSRQLVAQRTAPQTTHTQ